MSCKGPQEYGEVHDVVWTRLVSEYILEAVHTINPAGRLTDQ